MLGVDRSTVSSLIEDGELGSKEIGGVQRIFLSDLEAYLGEGRAHSLVREISSDEQKLGASTLQEDASESDGSEGDEGDSSETGLDVNFHMEVYDKEEAERRLGADGRRGRTSRYEPVAQKWSELPDGESIKLSGLEKHDVQNLRNLMYRRFGKESVIVRTAKQEDGTFKAVIRAREGDEYLREE